ncbi:flagellin [Brevibacillus borstelensis]|uniref:flagellin N-terminal helical domain-containing protein n=1 Tax=Brevibacillus borstelensis TaxID=45462 RepID=UPI00203BA8E1|nr:flagellin [Brevibacillus borstelensis]MCM3470998.1 flagellin [Brevibacillus borstelensis]
MRINHNIASLNTYRQLTGNTGAASKSLEKLSSGLRINRAGDDAAGLAISEKMRGQIRGLEMATKNSQDAISLIQTAEGAMNETHSILQRMRELAVQSSNGTNTDEDRKALQNEIKQLNAEIDRIGNTTEFNTKKLLNGEQNQTSNITTAGSTNLVSATVKDTMLNGDYTLDVQNATEIATNINAGGTGLDADTEIVLQTQSNNKFVIGAKYSIEVTNFNGGTNTADVVLKDENGAIVGTAVTSGAITSDIDFTLTGGDVVRIAANSITGNGTATFQIGEKADYTLKDANNNTIASVTNKVTTDGTVDLSGLRLTVDNTLANANDTVITVGGNPLKFQIGANSGQDTSLTISDMRAKALGVDTIDISTQSGAKAALDKIDLAIKTVSEERSKLGAVQNRLEHTINNLGTASENLTAAESRIRDVDMAKEMMEFTKNNILTQAAQAMLAQANQQPQGVLQLLR